LFAMKGRFTDNAVWEELLRIGGGGRGALTSINTRLTEYHVSRTGTASNMQQIGLHVNSQKSVFISSNTMLLIILLLQYLKYANVISYVSFVEFFVYAGRREYGVGCIWTRQSLRNIVFPRCAVFKRSWLHLRGFNVVKYLVCRPSVVKIGQCKGDGQQSRNWIMYFTWW
jgi:hypothetical protein